MADIPQQHILNISSPDPLESMLEYAAKWDVAKKICNLDVCTSRKQATLLSQLKKSGFSFESSPYLNAFGINLRIISLQQPNEPKH